MPESLNRLQTELELIYGNRFENSETYRNKVWQTLVEGWFQRHIPADSSVLDLGCGYGHFINNVACARKYAMDLNPVSRSKLNPEVVFLEQDCAAQWNLPAGSLDVVFSSNFFEHLQSKADLSQIAREAMRCLKKGGRIIAMGPNIRYVGGAYWDFFDHHLPLTEISVRECFEVAGFRTQFMLDRFLPYSMVNVSRYPMIFLRLYLRLPLLWKLLGQQFVVMVLKP